MIDSEDYYIPFPFLTPKPVENLAQPDQPVPLVLSVNSPR